MNTSSSFQQWGKYARGKGDRVRILREESYDVAMNQ